MMSNYPYAPPRHTPPEEARTTYEPLGWRTTAGSVCIGASVALGLVTSGITAAIGTPSQERMGAVAVLALVSLVMLAVSTFGWVIFLVWVHQAAKNVRAFGQQGMAFTPGWCVGWWFIPFASLWMPYLALAEIWRASDPETVGKGGREWLGRKLPGTFPLWWGSWTLSAFVGAYGTFQALMANMEGRTPDAGNGISLASQAMTGIAAIAIITIMRALDARQQACAAAINPSS